MNVFDEGRRSQWMSKPCVALFVASAVRPLPGTVCGIGVYIPVSGPGVMCGIEVHIFVDRLGDVHETSIEGRWKAVRTG